MRQDFVFTQWCGLIVVKDKVIRRGIKLWFFGNAVLDLFHIFWQHTKTWSNLVWRWWWWGKMRRVWW